MTKSTELKKEVSAEVKKQDISADEFFGSEVVETNTNHVTIMGDNGGTAIFKPSETSFYSSIAAETLDQKRMVMKALGNSDYNLKAVAEKKIMYVTDVIAHNITLTKDDGSMDNADRIVLIMEDGTTVSGCSKGFKSSIQNLFNIFGRPPYSTPLPIKVMDVTTRKGNNTFNITIAEDSDELPRIGRIKK